MIVSMKARQVLLFLLLITACESDDFFEQTNPPENPWLTVQEYERAVVAPYNLAFSSGWGSYWGNERLTWDCTSDLCYLIPNTSADISFNHYEYRWFEQPMRKANNAFERIYQAIGLCNGALEFYYSKGGDPFPSATESDKTNNVDRIAGELHLIRAYSYWNATSWYCPPPQSPQASELRLIPLNTKLPENLEEPTKPYYATTTEIFDSIVSDLVKAKALLPVSYISTVHHPSYEFGRANRFAAASMLSRVFFLLGEDYWEDALNELNYVINSGKYSLDQDPIESFNRNDATQSDEVIWNIPYYDPTSATRDASVLSSMNKTHIYSYGGGRGEFWSSCPWRQFCLSDYAAIKVGWMDSNLNETEEAIKDKRYVQLYYRLEGNNGDPSADFKVYETQWSHVKEPKIWGDKYFRSQDGRNSNCPIIRLAELYLTRAIINYKKGNINDALGDINIVRQRAGIGTLTELTEDDIHHERIKEFAFEGDRIRYLQALRKPIGPGDKVDDNGNPLPDIEFPYNDVYWLIPQAERDYRDNQ